jgi:hypothetical protein
MTFTAALSRLIPAVVSPASAFLQPGLGGGEGVQARSSAQVHTEVVPHQDYVPAGQPVVRRSEQVAVLVPDKRLRLALNPR